MSGFSILVLAVFAALHAAPVPLDASNDTPAHRRALSLREGPPDPREISAREARLLIRTLDYVRSIKPKSPLTFAIVFDPENKVSSQEAERLAELLDAAPQSDKGKLEPLLIPLTNLNQSLKHIQVLYLTHGLKPFYTVISERAALYGLLTLSTDPSCVRANGCVLSIQTESGIDILINEKIMKRNRIDFEAAFQFAAQYL